MFLLCNKVNQPYVYTHPFLLKPPFAFPRHTPSSLRSTRLSSLCCIAAAPLAVSHAIAHVSNLLSPFVSPPLLPFPTLPCPHTCSLCFLLYSCPAYRLVCYHLSAFQMHALIHDNLFFSFWLTTIWQTLDLSTSQMIQFCSFLWLSNIPSYMCTHTHTRMYIYTSHSYPFICWCTFRLLSCLGYCKYCCNVL